VLNFRISVPVSAAPEQPWIIGGGLSSVVAKAESLRVSVAGLRLERHVLTACDVALARYAVDGVPGVIRPSEVLQLHAGNLRGEVGAFVTGDPAYLWWSESEPTAALYEPAAHPPP
jgi:hypothetical protein